MRRTQAGSYAPSLSFCTAPVNGNRQLRARAHSFCGARQRKKLERRLAQQSSTATLVRVGASIEARVETQLKEHGGVAAHWVRGHYHHYWTGKGRSVKVRKWVQPYPKGLDDKVESDQ